MVSQKPVSAATSRAMAPMTSGSSYGVVAWLTPPVGVTASSREEIDRICGLKGCSTPFGVTDLVTDDFDELAGRKTPTGTQLGLQRGRSWDAAHIDASRVPLSSS